MRAYNSIITTGELAAILGSPGTRVVDCRFDLQAPSQGYRDYLAGHIPAAVYADLDKDLAAPPTPSSGRHPLPAVADFLGTLERLGITNDSQVIAYDGAGGGIAARLWWMLRWLGHDRVAVLDGGYAAWVDEGRPHTAGPVAARAGRFVPAVRHDWVLETDELAAALQRGERPVLVDAREAARYRGEQEPIDAVAGHVPGASNFPFAQNLDAAGRWRSGAALKSAWLAHFDGTLPPAWAVMCGSGVTACHLALSAACAGLPAPRLYAGSWSEWIRDPRRPRATAR